MLMRLDEPSWKVLGKLWPHHQTSRFVEAGGMRWHVQEMGLRSGEAPTLLLVHGAGASTHSWRDLMPALVERFHLVAVDLPGHAFSGRPRQYRPTIGSVSGLLEGLIAKLGIDVHLGVGHSAGAAILCQMVLDKKIAPAGLVSFNGAFQPFEGVARRLFPALAKLMFVNPLTPRMIAMSGRDISRVVTIIEGTGSRLSDEGFKFYQILMREPAHIAGVLALMAHWDLERVSRDMVAVEVPLLLIAGEEDRAVPPKVAIEMAARIASASQEVWPGLGHLAHEENPEKAVERIIGFAKQVGALAQD